MLRLHSEQLWSEIARLAQKTKKKLAAVAYISDDEIIKFGERDLLVVDASDEAIKSGRTNARVIKDAFYRNAKIYSNQFLHAKIMLFDSIAVIGSGNISFTSRNTLHEAAVFSDRPELVASVIDFIEQLAKLSQAVDQSFIERICEISVERPYFTSVFDDGKRPNQPKIKLRNPRTWILAGKEIDYPGNDDVIQQVKDEVASEEPDTSTEVDWFWWRGSSLFCREAQRGDLIVWIYPAQSVVGVRVYKHATIRKVFQENDQHAKTYHCAWPTDCEKTALTWKQFERLSQRAGITFRLHRGICRELNTQQSSALFELWDAGRKAV